MVILHGSPPYVTSAVLAKAATARCRHAPKFSSQPLPFLSSDIQTYIDQNKEETEIFIIPTLS